MNYDYMKGVLRHTYNGLFYITVMVYMEYLWCNSPRYSWIQQAYKIIMW